MTQNILVTGGNAGIGLALCKRLYAANHNVFLGSRSTANGDAAVAQTKASAPGSSGAVTLVQLDVADVDSIAAAAAKVEKILGSARLNALVNNAGCAASSRGVTARHVMDVNLYGVKNVTDAFLHLLNSAGRICNTGSGSGPMWLEKQSNDVQKQLFSAQTFDQLAAIAEADVATVGPQATGFAACYGASKALMHAYTRVVARENPQLVASAVSPGLVETKLTSDFQMSNMLTPEEGTKSLWYALFENPLPGSGFYYGSDCKRSPWHKYRAPGTPPYDGIVPTFS